MAENCIICLKETIYAVNEHPVCFTHECEQALVALLGRSGK